MGADEKLISRITVIGAIRKKLVNTTVYLMQKIGQYSYIGDILVGQIRSHDVAVFGINSKVKLAPGPTRAGCLLFAKAFLAPFTRPKDLQSGAVDNQIQAALDR